MKFLGKQNEMIKWSSNVDVYKLFKYFITLSIELSLHWVKI